MYRWHPAGCGEWHLAFALALATERKMHSEQPAGCQRYNVRIISQPLNFASSFSNKRQGFLN
jgi:hypothetical protein